MNAIEIIFPKGRSELIRLLFTNPEREFHLRELSRLSNLAVGTIQKEVARLSSVDLIVARRDGNRLYYRANQDHPITSDLRNIALKTTGLRDQVAAALEGISGVEFAFVFGSQASGTAGAESDIDLMVVGNVGLRALAPRLRPLISTLGREINPHIRSLQSLDSKALSNDTFFANVLDAPKIWIIGSPDELAKLV
jgi:predicted nucleotidyltransferase